LIEKFAIGLFEKFLEKRQGRGSQDGRTQNATNESIPYILVLASSASSFTEITEYT